MASGFEDGSDGSDGVQDEEVEAAAEAEYAKVEEVLEVAEDAEDAEVERDSLAERKKRMKEKKMGAKGARAPLKRSGYRIPKRPLDAVHREVIVAQVARDAEVTKLRTQWNSLTVGKPKGALPGRRVRFRL